MLYHRSAVKYADIGLLITIIINYQIILRAFDWTKWRETLHLKNVYPLKDNLKEYTSIYKLDLILTVMN